MFYEADEIVSSSFTVGNISYCRPWSKELKVIDQRFQSGGEMAISKRIDEISDYKLS